MLRTSRLNPSLNTDARRGAFARFPMRSYCLTRWISVLALATCSAHAAPITATLTVLGASGEIRMASGQLTSFSNLPVTFTASSDTSLVYRPTAQSLAFDAPITISLPGIIAAIAAVPTSHVEAGAFDATRGFIDFELGTKVAGVVMLQGADAFDPALLNYHLGDSFGPQHVALASVGSIGAPIPMPLVVNTLDGTLITISASSDGTLAVALASSSGASPVPASSDEMLLLSACVLCLVGAIALRARQSTIVTMAPNPAFNPDPSPAKLDSPSTPRWRRRAD
jgi:hypothetical protein